MPDMAYTKMDSWEKYIPTWEIVINVVKGRDETVKFHHLEHRVEEFLSAYQDKTLNDVPPFDSDQSDT